jgi:hypothetical protein
MSTTLTINGVGYEFPAVGENPWGPRLIAWATAATNGLLQKSGGTFALLNELDFGASYGLKTSYIKSRGTNVAAAGVVRLANNESISWRNQANGADVPLKVNTLNVLEFNGELVPTRTEIDAKIPKVLSGSFNLTADGPTIYVTAASTLAFGDVCYIASNGKATLIDADAIASMSGCIMLVDTSVSADASGTFLLLGVATKTSWNWTVGGLLYGTVTGTTGNTMSQTAPTGTDDVVQILGVALSATKILFYPQLVQVEVA